MLERAGARTALVTTRGFRDVYEIGRINRPESYNLFFRKHRPLVERALRFEVNERVNAAGEVLAPLDEAELEAIAPRLEAEGVEAIAILFLHSYRNPDHELAAQRFFRRRCPGMFVSTSHELSQEYREFERTSTVVGQRLRRPARGHVPERGRRLPRGRSVPRPVPDRAVDRRPLRQHAGAAANASACSSRVPPRA